MNNSEKAHLDALTALGNKDYRAAVAFFKLAENQFADNPELRILKEVTDLLLAVKNEIIELEKDEFTIEEIYTHGQETELRG